MRRTIPAAVAVVALLSGCGGGGTTSSSDPAGGSAADAASASPTYTPPSAEELKAALVTAADLPTGYTVVAPEEQDDDALTSECGKRLQEIAEGAVDPFSEATVEFTNDESFASLEHQWGAYGSADEVEGLFDDAENFFGDCDSFTETLEGNEVTFRIEEADVADLGDRSFAYTVSGKVPSQIGELTFGMVLIAVQRGPLAQTVFQGGLGEVDLATATKVAQLGLERAEAL